MRRFEDQITFLGMAGASELPQYRAFVDKYDLGVIAHAIDPDRSLWASFGVSYQPAWVFIDADGSVDVHAGAYSAADLDARLEELAAS